MPKLTFHQPQPGSRILLMLGNHQCGAVFPPCGSGHGRYPWVWRWWLGGVTETKEGRATTDQAAKNELLAVALDWLRRAGLEHG